MHEWVVGPLGSTMNKWVYIGQSYTSKAIYTHLCTF